MNQVSFSSFQLNHLKKNLPGIYFSYSCLCTGKIMEDEKTVAEYNIAADKFIVAMVTKVKVRCFLLFCSPANTKCILVKQIISL